MSGLVNFRELGGLKTAYGTIRRNRLFRSGELVEVGKEDINSLIRDHQLKMIVDFRDKKRSRVKTGCYHFWCGVLSYRHYEINQGK